MALRAPVVAYDAATNVEAQLIKMLLVEAGVEAFALEDVSVVGLWMAGTLPEIHKPQVYVDKSDLDRARPILQDYELQAANRERQSQGSDTAPASHIEVECEECGESTLFPSSQRGSVQICPRCGGHVDVGEVDDGDAFWIGHDVTE